MQSDSLSQQDQLCHSQNECLYKGVMITALGTLISSFVVFTSLFGKSDLELSLVWLLLINLAYAGRVLDSRLFFKDAQSSHRSHIWKIRFSIGSFCGAFAWASCIWFLFPVQNIEYAALPVIVISAVGASALASTPYRSGIALTFLSVLGLGLVLKLLLVGGEFAMALAIYSLTIFIFLLTSSLRISTNFTELLRMKLDSQNANSTMMSVTEDMAKMGYWSWHMGADKIDISDSLCRLLQLESTQVSVHELQSCIHPQDQSRVTAKLESFSRGEIADEQMIEYRLDSDKYGCERFIRQFAKPIKNADGHTVLFGSVQDTTQFRNAEQKIYQMAYSDALTNLANRAHFLESLDEKIEKASRHGTGFALLYLDIDNFKEVNDSFGHKCGDIYLKDIAQFLSTTLEPDHFVARLGGDEFSILLDDVQTYDSVLQLISGFHEYKNQSLKLGPYSIKPRFSVGVAIYPEHGDNPDDLVKHADLAMYNAKQHEDINIALYCESMSLAVSLRLQMEADIRQALAEDEFELWYQPKINLETKTISGFEALIRWIKGGEVVPPDMFIPIAETVGLIDDIGEWVLDKACDQMMLWNAQGHKVNIAVNISSSHFSSDNFLPTVRKILEVKDFDPQDLEIEITESLSRDPDVQTAICRDLKTLGLCVAIDDFGTGYSSLSVLSELEINNLKIDRSFISNLPDCKESGILVKTIVELAKGLNFDIVAEGVETEGQLRYLEDLGCKYAQGYYYSKPVTVEEASHLLSAGIPELVAVERDLASKSNPKAA